MAHTMAELLESLDKTREAAAPVLHEREVTGAFLRDRTAQDRASGSKKDLIWFRLVTPAKDAHGTVILPGGVDLSLHKKNPLWLWMHRSGPKKDGRVPKPEDVIGRVDAYDQTEDHLDVGVTFDDQDAFGLQCKLKVERDFIRSCSIGFEGEAEIVEITEEHARVWHGCTVGEKVPVFRKTLLVEGSLVIMGSNEEALKLLRAIPDSYPPPVVDVVTAQAEPAGSVGNVSTPSTTGTQPAQPDTDGSASTRDVGDDDIKLLDDESGDSKPKKHETPEKGRPPMSKHLNKPENRWMHRDMISGHLYDAEHHMRAMQQVGEHDGKDHPHFKMHRDMASGAMENAAGCATMLRDALDSMPDGERVSTADSPEMQRAKRPEAKARKVPNCGDATLETRFREVLGLVDKFDTLAVREVVSEALGTDDADRVDARIAALQTTQERFKEVVEQQQAARADVQSEEREKLIRAMEDSNPRLITPAFAKRARDEKWSLDKLGEFRAEVTRSGGFSIERVAPLHPASGAGAGASSSSTSVNQPQVEPGPGTSQRTKAVEDNVREMGERYGWSKERTERAIQSAREQLR